MQAEAKHVEKSVANAAGQEAASSNRPDRILADFNGPDYGGWTAHGSAFGGGPTSGVASSARPGKRNVYGTLTSPEFLIDRRYLNFLIGGDSRGAQLRLLIEGGKSFTAEGLTPGALFPACFDLSAYQGQQGRIEIHDFSQERSGAYASIQVDDLRLSDNPVLTTLERTIRLEGRYLNVPAARKGRPARFLMEIEGLLIRCGEILVPTENNPDYWLSFDFPNLEGKEALLRLSDAPGASCALARTYSSPLPHDSETLYKERLRPGYHFSPRNGWLNDPNGLVHHEGVYHLFYQHNALGLNIANQSWGHAVSRDLIRWEHLPVVLEPMRISKGRSYSGSAVIDRQNRAGFGANAMIAVYTDTGGGAAERGLEAEGQRAEAIAFSTDGGGTFSYFEGNPVFRHPEKGGGRDPKVFWWPVHDCGQKDPNGHWVMVVYSKHNDRDAARILISNDLKRWTQTDLVPDHYECVELFELPLMPAEGERTGKSKWVLQGGNGTYHLGDFDGRRFVRHEPQKRQTLQQPGYAFQCFNHTPDGRVITIGWIRRHTDWEDMPFSQMMGIPLELTLRETRNGARVFANPVREFDTLRRETWRRENLRLTELHPVELPGRSQQFDIEVVFRPATDQGLTIELGADRVEWSKGRLNRKFDLPVSDDGTVTLRVLVDRPLIEIIGNRGALYAPFARKEQGNEVAPRLCGNAEIVLCRIAEIASAR